MKKNFLHFVEVLPKEARRRYVLRLDIAWLYGSANSPQPQLEQVTFNLILPVMASIHWQMIVTSEDLFRHTGLYDQAIYAGSL